MSKRPQFAAVVGVKDEVELIAHCIRHLRRIGVGAIRVLDSGSRDGTLERLASVAGPDLTVTHHSDQDPDAAAWTRTASRLARESDAEWVLFLDADEFWIPAGGSLHSIAGLDTHDVLVVDRFNVPLDAGGLLTANRKLPTEAAGLELIVRSLPGFRGQMEKNPDLPWIRIVPAAKVMARTSRIRHVLDGFHEIVPTAGPPLRRGRAPEVLVAHVPYTTLPRFAAKVRNIRRIFAVHDDYCGADMAWHWRRLLACRDEESVRREFDLQVFDERTLAALRLDGTVVSATEWFARQAPRG